MAAERNMDTVPELVQMSIKASIGDIDVTFPADGMDDLEPAEREETARALGRFAADLCRDDGFPTDEDIRRIRQIKGLSMIVPTARGPVEFIILPGGPVMITHDSDGDDGLQPVGV